MTNEQKFRVCPGCGNLTPAESPDCPYCGLNSAEALKAQREAAREHHFFQALFTRQNPFTLIFVGINVGVFLLEWLAGGMGATAADPQVLEAFGAKVNSLVADHHQYWRLITSMFIHIGFLHLLLNNYALWIIGMEIERIYGSARFVVLYFLTGLAGSVASYLFTDATSAGASGAIFGLFGVMATFAFRFRKEIPDALGQEIRRRVLPIIAINLVFGFSVKIVDNAAHLGGLLAGVLLALVIPYKRPEERATPFWVRLLQYALIAAAVASFIFAFTNYNGPQLSFANLSAKPTERMENYYQKMEDADGALVDSLNSFGEVLYRQSNDPKPALDAAERGLNVLKDVPKLPEEHDQRRVYLLEVLTKQKEIIERYMQSNEGNRQKIKNEEDDLIKKAKEYKLIQDQPQSNKPRSP